MASAQLWSRVLRAYRGAKKAGKTYLVFEKDIDKKYRRLLRFPKVVIRSKADLEVVIKMKLDNLNWQVKGKVSTKYKANSRDEPLKKRLWVIAHKAGIEFVPRKVRRD